MEKSKEIFKHGYHPKNEKSLRGQVSGLVGRGNKNTSSQENTHVARPLASLRDPATFAPPPKHAGYHGGIASPSNTSPSRPGLGAPLTGQELSSQQEQPSSKPVPPPLPYRADRTGLRTTGLPVPPKPNHSLSDDNETQPKPKLPPRLPPRQNSQPNASSPPPPYTEIAPHSSGNNGILNRAATSRLAQSGVSVPSFGIHSNSSPSQPAAAPPPGSYKTHDERPSPTSPSLGSLQDRFSSLSTSTSPAQDTPAKGTSFAQKQAALTTVSQLQRDPSKVSGAEARQAMSTANNFRQRHGEDAAKGWEAGNRLNQRYGIAEKAQNYAGTSQVQPGRDTNTGGIAQESSPWAGQVSGMASKLGGIKKAPPPPPPNSRKPADLITAGASSPPPIPLGSKPR